VPKTTLIDTVPLAKKSREIQGQKLIAKNLPYKINAGMDKGEMECIPNYV